MECRFCSVWGSGGAACFDLTLAQCLSSPSCLPGLLPTPRIHYCPAPTPTSSPPPPPPPTQVALSTAAQYQAALGGLAGLTPQGAAQLAADLEYFCNVLTTLGVAVPPSLAAWQAAAAAPVDGLPALAADAGEVGAVGALEAVHAVAALRGVQLPAGN